MTQLSLDQMREVAKANGFYYGIAPFDDALTELRAAASAFLTDVQSGADATRVSESGAALERLLRGETANG